MEHNEFSRWLRMQRRVEKPMSQEKLGELVGVGQWQVSRWELGEGTPPDLAECVRLARVFDANVLDLARMCGRWDDEVERLVLATLNNDMPGYRGSLVDEAA